MVKLVTFNLRCPCKVDGENYFFNRLPFIIRKIQEERPTVMGFQEMTDDMFAAMRDALPEYAFVGMGRNQDFRGESCRIAFLKESVEMQAMDQLWLSPTPRQAGSRFPVQSEYPRVCTWVKLIHWASGRRFYVLNAHLDHEAEQARTLGLKLLLDTAEQMTAVEELPFFIMGDFNFEPQKESYALIENSAFADLTQGEKPTFHGFGQCKAEKIDYILTNRPQEKYTVGRWHEEHQGVFLSDHDALVVEWHE